MGSGIGYGFRFGKPDTVHIQSEIGRIFMDTRYGFGYGKIRHILTYPEENSDIF